VQYRTGEEVYEKRPENSKTTTRAGGPGVTSSPIDLRQEVEGKIKNERERPLEHESKEWRRVAASHAHVRWDLFLYRARERRTLGDGTSLSSVGRISPLREKGRKKVKGSKDENQEEVSAGVSTGSRGF